MLVTQNTLYLKFLFASEEYNFKQKYLKVEDEYKK